MKISSTITNAVSWRSEGIVYRKNEVFLDVIESVNLLVNATGSVIRSEILGVVKMRCYLTGMPELKLGLNDKVMLEGRGKSEIFPPSMWIIPKTTFNDPSAFSKGTRKKVVEMEDVRFHQCVRLTRFVPSPSPSRLPPSPFNPRSPHPIHLRFENDKTISFIPPDGDFELMSYRIAAEFKPLVWVEATVKEHSGSRIEYTVKVRSQYKKRSTANGVEITVPVSDDASTPKFKVRSRHLAFPRMKC